MHATLITLVIISAIGIIAIVLLQSGKSSGLSGSITGGAEQLFGKQKARGMEKVLHRLTILFAVIIFVVSFVLAYFID